MRQIAKQKTIPQSFLFAGPSQVGKFLVAKEFAGELVGSPEYLDEETGVRVLAPSEGRSISIESVREAERFLTRSAGEGKYRVLIVDDADRLTREGENAFLKLLEEPLPQTVVLFVSHRPDYFLPTTRSRLFPLFFHPVSPQELREAFPESDLLPDFFFQLGLPGLLSQAFSQPETFTQTKDILRKLFQLTALSWRERFALAEQLAERPGETPQLLWLWVFGLWQMKNRATTFSLSEANFFTQALEVLEQVESRSTTSQRVIFEDLFARVASS